MGVLVLGEHVDGALTDGTRRAVTAAHRLGEPVELLLLGDASLESAVQGLEIGGVARIHLLLGEVYASGLAEPVGDALAEQIREQGVSALVAATSSLSRDVLPRVAAALDVAMVSEAVAIEDAETFVRPVYGGRLLARVRCAEPVRVVTVRGSRFEPAPAGEAPPVERREPAAGPEGRSRVVEDRPRGSQRPELTSARVVVAGGRGLASAGVEPLEALADRLGAAVGASRGAVDAGLLPHDLQIGLTAKVIAPELYIAVGISGAVYHVSGIGDSRVIVAINSDPEAPIHQLADYALVADAAQALPQLIEALEPS